MELKFKEINTSLELEEKILEKISLYEEKRAFWEKVLGYTAIIISLFVFLNFIKGFGNSNFFNYLSLAFSDTKIIFSNFGDFLSGLVVSMPIFEMTIISLMLAVILYSLSYIKNANNKLIFNIK